MPARSDGPAAALSQAACLTALSAVPIFFAVFTDRVFEPEKSALLRWLALIAAAGLLTEALASRRDRASATSVDRGRRAGAWLRDRDPLALALAAVWLSALLSSLGSVAPAISLMGSEARGQGLATTTALAVMAICAARVVAGPAGPLRLAAFVGASLLPAGLYAVIQAYGLDPLPWDGDVVTRVSGPAGSSVLLAAQLVMALPMATWLTGRAWKAGARRAARHDALEPALGLAAWLLVCAIGTWALLLSSSRGPLLGLASGLLALGLAKAVREGRRSLGAASLLGGLALAGLILALNFGPPALDPLRELPVLDRISIALDPERSTTRVRLRLWEGSLDALEAAGPRLLLGYGPETMDLIWAPSYPPILAYDEPRGWVPDRAHNLVLDQLLTTGLLGLLAKLLLFGLLLQRCLVWMEEDPSRAKAGAQPGDRTRRGFAAASFVAVVASLVELQLGFAVSTTRLLLWTLAGALVGLGRPGGDALPTGARASRLGSRADRTLAVMVVGMTLIFGLVRPGLVGGGMAAVALLVIGTLGLISLAFAKPSPAALATAAGNGDTPPPSPPTPTTGPGHGRPLLLLLGFAMAQAWLAQGASAPSSADPGPALGGLGLYLLGLLIAIGWYVHSLAGPPWKRPSMARLGLALGIALCLGIWPVMAPLVAGALAKEGRRAWQAPVSELRAAGQSGRAESFLLRALDDYDRARRWAPWEPAYDLAAARAHVELADLLAARQRGDGSVSSTAAVDRQLSAAMSAIDEAERQSGPSPLPAVTRARTLRVWTRATREPARRALRSAETRSAYTDAIHLAPGWPELLDEAAAVALMDGDPRSTLRLSEAALTLDPFYRVAWRSHAEAQSALGAPGLAADDYARYFEDYRNDGDLATRRAQLVTLLEAGRQDEALDIARMLRAQAPGNAFARADLAALLEATKAHDEALTEARAAARLAPHDPGIAALLEALEAEAKGDALAPEAP